MAGQIICGNGFPSGLIRPKQLFILLHGVGAEPSDMLPVAYQFQSAYPDAVFQILEGISSFDAGGNGRQWFSVNGITEENRVVRVAEAMPALTTLVHHAQDHYGVLVSDTVLVGFSQEAIMALEFSATYDGGVGRVMAFSGRYARLPEKAPEFTTVHLLHGKMTM